MALFFVGMITKPIPSRKWYFISVGVLDKIIQKSVRSVINRKRSWGFQKTVSTWVIFVKIHTYVQHLRCAVSGVSAQITYLCERKMKINCRFTDFRRNNLSLNSLAKILENLDRYFLTGRYFRIASLVWMNPIEIKRL
jgi:hypothetical protein